MNFKSLQLRAQEDESAALREMRLWRWRDEEEDGDLDLSIDSRCT